ncbi:hypothetical protein [uncultured Dysgonomonas sp.]|uniref:hypothetical protein n=1 Tax=uncultured Dysgonomonas sp. TaxID=206096 RepID=UPI0025E0A58E|nr:hypothetical protein [uncultured Dysgonomonas sp.]
MTFNVRFLLTTLRFVLIFILALPKTNQKASASSLGDFTGQVPACGTNARPLTHKWG